jgi:predicted nucleic-acid-binding Zn-ribbon protein
MAEYERYDESRACPKCGNGASGRLNVSYHKGPSTGSVACTFEGEHMHRHCLACGYSWPEKPLA